jgi:hypothetical protein
MIEEFWMDPLKRNPKDEAKIKMQTEVKPKEPKERKL